MYRPVRIQAPLLMPVSLAEAKLYCRVDGTEDDSLIASLIAAAVDHLDGRTGILGRCMVTQVWRYRADCLGGDTAFGMPGAVSATVTYTDTSGAPQVVDAAEFELREDIGGAVVIHRGPDPSDRDSSLPIMIDVTFGTDPEFVAESLKQAIRLLVAHWHLNREAIGDGGAAEIPLGFSAMVRHLRGRSI